MIYSADHTPLPPGQLVIALCTDGVERLGVATETGITFQPEQVISATARRILEARALYPERSLAQLYDADTMPPELRKAHALNDRAVMEAYGLSPETEEERIAAHLFRLYDQLTGG